jgi:hypothetical protein
VAGGRHRGRPVAAAQPRRGNRHLGAASLSEARPAFYALGRGGWRDYVTLLHPPYTAWHLSYVVIGASLAPRFDAGLLGATLAAFFLALGIGAHALDELRGRPLGTQIPREVLVALAVGSIAAATAVGVVVAARRDLWLLVFVGIGAFLVVAYNLELFGGAFHSDAWFAVAWGAFPLLTAYFVVAKTVRLEAVAAAAFAALTSLAQRTLSTQVRDVRRRTLRVTGAIEHADGTRNEIDRTTLTNVPEKALLLLSSAMVALAVALVLGRVT